MEVTTLPSDPIDLFASWFAEAKAAGAPEPTAMNLATSSLDGTPSSRMVLLKGVDARGFRFYTNYGSPKAADLDANPRVAACLFWPTLERSIRICGVASRTSRQDAEAYWQTRPRASQIASTASLQSTPVASRQVMEERYASVEQAHPGDGHLPLPENWGGYLIVPHSIEFWQGQGARFHDRFRYTRQLQHTGAESDLAGVADYASVWQIERLMP